MKKDLFVPQSENAIKVYEQQNAIKKDCTLSRYYITKDYFNTHMKQFVAKAGDLIVSCAGTIGEVYELPKDAEEGVFNQALMRVRVNNEIVNKEIFITVFSSMIDKFSKIYSNGSAIKNIPPFADLKRTQVYLPCKEEQIVIAQLLRSLDERIATQSKIIDKLQSLIKGINQRVFMNNGINYKLGEVCEIRSGYSGNQLLSKKGLKVSRIETISGHKVNLERVGYVAPFESSENYKLQVGDILFSNINSVEYIGNTAFIDKDYNLYHGMNLLRLTPNNMVVIPFYLYLLLNTNRMLNRFKTICNKAVSQASINQTELGKTVVQIPDINAQKQICELYQALYDKLESEKYANSLFQKQKQYLLRQMFI